MPRAKGALKPFHLVRYIIGILLLPLALAGTATFFGHLNRFQLGNYVQLAFVTGAGVYLVMHLLLWKPIFMHVMGHELTHAFWAFILGGRIKSFQVSPAGGQVTLSKSNFIIALAPYFFPFYSFLVFPIYFICVPKFQPVIALFLGFTLAFHIALTLHSLRDHQSDLQEAGIFFSLVFIYIMNLLILVVIISVIAPGVMGLREFVVETWNALQRLCSWVGGFVLAGKSSAP